MKRFLTLILAFLFVVTAFVSCGGGATDTETGAGEDTSSTTPTQTEPKEVEWNGVDKPPFLNYLNPVITFFVRTGFEHEVYVEELSDNAVLEATYWRNQTVEQRLGVEIRQINQAGGWSVYQEWNDTLRNAIQTESHDFDSAMIYAGCASSLAIEGCYLELSDVDYLSFEKPWWNQNILEEATVYGQLYFASGAIAHSQLSRALVIWYNKDIYKEQFATASKKDIYQVVRDGEWTIDYMYDLTSAVWVDNDSNGEKSSGDIVGLSHSAHGGNGSMDAWIYALGCDLTKMDTAIGEPVACFYNEHTVKAYEKLVKLYSDNRGSYCDFVNGTGGETGDTAFINGNVLMTLGLVDSGSAYSAGDFAYGVLPVPKYDGEQEKYRSFSDSGTSLVTILSTVEPERLDMVAGTIELMACEAYKQIRPVYVDVVLKSQNANSPDDAEMIQLVIDSLIYSFGWIFSSTHMGNMGKAFRVVDGSRDLTQYYESNQSNYEAMIDLLIDGYASMT